MFGIYFALKVLMFAGCISIVICAIVAIFIIAFCTPYWLWLGIYIDENDLPKSFRENEPIRNSIKYAAKFYIDLIHFRKPTL
jgi:hypothetical protein